MPRKTKQNDITSPELISKINPDNTRLMNDFLLYLKSLKRSEKTIAGYKNDLEIFFVFLLQRANNKCFVKISKRDIISFQNYVVYENENSPSRIIRLRSTLSSFSNYIENICDDIYPDFRKIVHKVETVKKEAVREKTVIKDEQLLELLDKLTKAQKYQQACCLALAAYSGARKSELVRFKVDFFDEQNLLLGCFYRTPKIKTKGQNGGKYIEKFVLKNEFKPYLQLWLEQREQLGITSEWLFVVKSNGLWVQAKPSTLNSWAKSFEKILEVPFYFHSMRHYWNTSLIKKGIPTSVIKTLTGWESEAMCSIYNDLTIEEEFSKYFDENGVKEITGNDLGV